MAGTSGEHQRTGRAAHPAGSALPEAAVLDAGAPALTIIEPAQADGVSWRSSAN